MLLLVMAYRLLREFRQASTRLDTPPFSNRHHLVSAIAPTFVRSGLWEVPLSSVRSRNLSREGTIAPQKHYVMRSYADRSMRGLPSTRRKPFTIVFGTAGKDGFRSRP